ncbi:MAG: serine protease [Treponema sp.]|nr:serine protease [Treponema sp.]
MKRLYTVSVVFLAALTISCRSTIPVSETGAEQKAAGISEQALKLAGSAVFEVLVEKAREDPSVYEKELNWEVVPYVIRTDKYYSIGTAFAISETELVTAFHVINLGERSMVYDRYYIRDSQGQVFEVDKITGGSNERDFLIFTVKGRTFTEFFRLEKDFETGNSVYSIGNALGEGIVIRNGLILGTVPEEEAGRWNLLKSSADGNPGNSGGPLVLPDGRVVGLVTGLRDNILYSVPAELILNADRHSLPYRIKPVYGHLILSNNLNRNFETPVPLPEHYLAVQDRITSAYRVDYDASMKQLFEEAPEYLTGSSSAYLLNSSLSSVFPQIDYVDPNDNNWKLSGLEPKIFNLPDDGQLIQASVSGFTFYKINKPDSAPLEKINTDPRYILDLMLQNMRTERTLWGNDKYRILSFGDPASVSTHTDALGRTWISAWWLIGYDDRVMIMYILPLPNGPALIVTTQPSTRKDIYEWDIRKLCDHIYAAYSADFEEWKNFIAAKSYVPDFLSDFRFDWQQGAQSFSLQVGSITIAADTQVFDWTGASELFLAPSWYKPKDTVEFGVRKVILNRDIRGKDFITIYRNIKPDPKLGAKNAEFWNDLVAAKYPFDEKPAISVKDNTGSVGVILPTENPNPSVRYSLYFSMENPQDEENLSRRLNSLKTGIRVWE